MWYVYVIESVPKEFRYIGSTNDLTKRLGQHNQGQVKSTKAYKPFLFVSYFALKDKAKAIKFEQYLKTGSGSAFLKKRIL